MWPQRRSILVGEEMKGVWEEAIMVGLKSAKQKPQMMSSLLVAFVAMTNLLTEERRGKVAVHPSEESRKRSLEHGD